MSKRARIKVKKVKRGNDVPQFKNANGDVCVRLTKDGIHYQTVEVKYLVAQSFVPNPNNYKYVRHIDGNKENNRADNLEWCENE